MWYGKSIYGGEKIIYDLSFINVTFFKWGSKFCGFDSIHESIGGLWAVLPEE